MTMKFARIALVALLAGCALPLAAADDVLLAAGRALSEQFERGETTAIAQRMTPPMRDAVGGAQGLAAFRSKVLSDAGPETGVIREDTTASGDLRVYRRIARRNVGQTPVLMEWVLTADNRIAGFQVRPQPIAIPSSQADEPTAIALALPFQGAWLVARGGRTLDQ
jgi:hypothetical protein